MLILQAGIVEAPNALPHITVLLYHEEVAMRRAAATCLGNLTEHQTRLGAAQVQLLWSCDVLPARIR